MLSELSIELSCVLESIKRFYLNQIFLWKYIMKKYTDYNLVQTKGLKMKVHS